MYIEIFFQRQSCEKLNELQDEPDRKCPKVDNTKMMESTDDELSESSRRRIGQ